MNPEKVSIALTDEVLNNAAHELLKNGKFVPDSDDAGPGSLRALGAARKTTNELKKGHKFKPGDARGNSARRDYFERAQEGVQLAINIAPIIGFFLWPMIKGMHIERPRIGGIGIGRAAWDMVKLVSTTSQSMSNSVHAFSHALLSLDDGQSGVAEVFEQGSVFVKTNLTQPCKHNNWL